MTDTLTQAIIDSIQDRKGRDITLIDLKAIETAPAPGMVICTGGSPTQVAAIADSIREGVQQRTGQKPYNYDGYSAASWIVIDYGSTMVHIFLPETRKFYDIEQLWCDGVIREVPDLD